MLKIQNLVAGYNGIKIINKVNLEIKPKEIVALIGPNGSGKTTLFRSIFNLCEIYSGKITFYNKNITKWPTHKLIYEGISFVPQGRQVFSDLTVKENLEMGAFIIKDNELIKKNIRAVFEKFPFLKEKQNEHAFKLSGGQQQMLVIARALMQNPKLLLIDEPSLGLSPKMTNEVFEKIKQINNEGVSIIIAEQNVKKAIEVANRICVLEEGSIALEGGKNITKNKDIKKIYLGDD